MLCFRYRKLLIPYSESELGTDVARKLERHLMKCARCRMELDGIRLVAGALCDTDPPMEPANDLWARVSAQIASQPVQPVRQKWFGLAGGLAAGAAAAVVVAAVGMALLGPGTEPVVTTAKHDAAAPSIKMPVTANQPDTRTRVAVKAPESAKQPNAKAARTQKQPGKALEMAKAAPATTLWAYKGATRNPKPTAGGHVWFEARGREDSSVSKKPRKGIEVATNYSQAKGLVAYGVTRIDGEIAPGRAAQAETKRGAPVVSASAGGKLGADRTAGTLKSWGGNAYYYDNATDARDATAPAAVPAAPLASDRAGAASVDAERHASGDMPASAADFSRDVNLGYYTVTTTSTTSSTSVVDDLNETEGIRTAAIFSYP